MNPPLRAHHRVFLASSRDVQPERDALPGVLDRVNRSVADLFDIWLDLWRWEEHALPGLHPDGPQALINPDLDQAEIVMLVIWDRFGNGTAEEAARSIERWKKNGKPRVMIYFCRRPSVLDTEEQLEQRKRVIAFRKMISSLGLFSDFTDTADFQRHVEADLRALAKQLARP